MVAEEVLNAGHDIGQLPHGMISDAELNDFTESSKPRSARSYKSKGPAQSYDRIGSYFDFWGYRMRALIGLVGALALGLCLTLELEAKEAGWFGATVKTVTPSTRLPKGLSLASGLIIISTPPDGPAAKAGLRPGDVIVSIDGKPTTSAEAFLRFAEDQGAGTTLTVLRARAGEGQSAVTVVLASKVAAAPAPSKEEKATKKSKLPEPAREREAEKTEALRRMEEMKAQETQRAQEAQGAKREKDEAGAKGGEVTKDGEGAKDGGGAEEETERSRSLGSPAPEVTDEGKATVGESRGIIENAPATSGSGTTSPDLPYTTVKVFYATDRKEGDGKKPASSYGGDRGTITYGTCDVTVPKDHRVGEVESPSFIRLEFSENPAKHVILANVEKQSATDFYRDVWTKVAASKGKSAFIFVHGYNVKFEDAARRTAQMSYDLKFDGAPVFFSWPSQGTYLGYTVDESNIEYARSDLKKFIIEFDRASSAEQIYLVAHSMGNRALTTAVADVYREAPDVNARIKEVILAAPDIDADVFKRDIAPALIGDGQLVTLYASSEGLGAQGLEEVPGPATRVRRLLSYPE